MRKSLKLSLSLMVTGLLATGCGGGSDSSSALFEKADPAPVTVDSGKEVAKNVAAGKSSSGLGSLDMNSESGNKAISDASSNTGMLSNIIVNLAKENSKTTTNSLNQAIDNEVRCTNGGTMHISGDVTSTKVNMVTTYKECSMGANYFDGAMKISMKMKNSSSLEYMNIGFPSDFHISTGAQNIKYFKNGKIDMNNISGKSFDMTTTIKVDMDGKLYGSDHSSWHYSGNSTYQTSGKEYIDNLSSYVTYDESYDMSETPFEYGSYGLRSGESHYIGANGGKIVLKVENGDLIVQVDSDNDGTFETTEKVSY